MTVLELVERDLKKARINLEKAKAKQNTPPSELEHMEELCGLRAKIVELIEENEKLLTVIFKKEDTMQIILQEHQAEYDSMAKSVNEASDLIRKLKADKEELVNAYKKLSEEHEKILNHYFIDTKIGSGTSRQKCIEETVLKMAKILQDEIKSALDSNYRARQERIDKWKDPNAYIGGDFVNICDGKIAALRGIDDFIGEIVDKMLEENK